MNRKISFAEGEWYHCYARGVDKRKIFLSNKDYERFLMLLYTCNSDTSVHISNIEQSKNQGVTLIKALETERGEPLVTVGAYSLMPNHYHLLLRQNSRDGITRFMRKLGTGYTMYFNIKNDRTGSLFSGTFRAHHVQTDQYLKRLCHYIHANAAELQEPAWKDGVIKNLPKLKDFLRQYRFSSLPTYNGEIRAEKKILDEEALLSVLDDRLNLDKLIQDAQDFINPSR